MAVLGARSRPPRGIDHETRTDDERSAKHRRSCTSHQVPALPRNKHGIEWQLSGSRPRVVFSPVSDEPTIRAGDLLRGDGGSAEVLVAASDKENTRSPCAPNCASTTTIEGCRAMMQRATTGSRQSEGGARPDGWMDGWMRKGCHLTHELFFTLHSIVARQSDSLTTRWMLPTSPPPKPCGGGSHPLFYFIYTHCPDCSIPLVLYCCRLCIVTNRNASNGVCAAHLGLR
jgi:hypothetical protein